jgi:hypothetical protein
MIERSRAINAPSVSKYVDTRVGHGGNLDALMRSVDLDDVRDVLEHVGHVGEGWRHLEIDAREVEREECEGQS